MKTLILTTLVLSVTQILLSTSFPSSSRVENETLIPNLSLSVSTSAKDLFETLEKNEDPLDNVIISPLSIHLAMSLLYYGAEEDSKEQIADVMSFLNISDDSVILEESKQLLESYGELKKNLTTNIELANSAFTDERTDLKDEYESILTEYFLTKTRKVNFSQPDESAELINDWVANKTNNLIKDLVSPGSLSPDTRLMLINAVYFKANWQLPFEHDGTSEETFFVNENVTLTADMMVQENEILYGTVEDLQSQVVSLQYEDPNFTMIVFLPNSAQSLEALSKKLIEVDFNSIHESLDYHKLLLRMPKFKLGYKTELVSTLKSLGVVDIFDAALANLTGITDEDLFVSDILHETKIEVNEEGSEAAGATGIQLDTRAGGSRSKIVMIDRPFMFVIQDLKNNIPLFMGKIMNPSEEDLNSSSLNVESVPQENVIAVRNEDPNAFLEDLKRDPEELAHMKNNPEYAQGKECQNSTTSADKILFPCPDDTQPIEDYKKAHGDPSRLGVNGENAALLQTTNKIL